MAVEITKKGGTIKVDEGGTIEYYPIDDVLIKVESTNLVLYHQLKQFARFEFADITLPAGADIEEKADAIAILSLGADAPAVWSAKAQISPNDTGTINIAANPDRKVVRISNDINGERSYFLFGDFLPVFEEDILIDKGITFIFPVAESGADKIRFVMETGKTTTITYQEAT